MRRDRPDACHGRRLVDVGRAYHRDTVLPGDGRKVDEPAEPGGPRARLGDNGRDLAWARKERPQGGFRLVDRTSKDDPVASGPHFAS